MYGYCCGIVGIDPNYFLDEMSQDEVLAIMKAKHDSEIEVKKRSWEQARLISFFSFVGFRGTKEVKKPEDLFKLSWDAPDKKKLKTSLKDIKNLKKQLHG